MGYSFTIETAEPTAADLVSFIKQHNIKTKLLESSKTSRSGFDEIHEMRLVRYSSLDKQVLV